MLNENIKILRKARGLSQEELAIRLNVVRQTVSKWENGLSVPDAGMLMEIADALDTTVNVLLGEAIPEPEQPSETIQTLAAKLELLNRQIAERNERSRKQWHIFFAMLGILTLSAAARAVTVLIGLLQIDHQMASSAIIGGADGPTSIMITSRYAPWLAFGIILAMGVVSVIGLCRTRRK